MNGRHHILIVEDDCDTRDALQALLELHGYTVTPAANGAEGLALLHGGLRPCVIVLDLMMPEKNGFQFRVEQVLDPELAEIPVVVYSGDVEAQANAGVLGAAANLRKPVAIDELIRVIRGLC